MGSGFSKKSKKRDNTDRFDLKNVKIKESTVLQDKNEKGDFKEMLTGRITPNHKDESSQSSQVKRWKAMCNLEQSPPGDIIADFRKLLNDLSTSTLSTHQSRSTTTKFAREIHFNNVNKATQTEVIREIKESNLSKVLGDNVHLNTSDNCLEELFEFNSIHNEIYKQTFAADEIENGPESNSRVFNEKNNSETFDYNYHLRSEIERNIDETLEIEELRRLLKEKYNSTNEFPACKLSIPTNDAIRSTSWGSNCDDIPQVENCNSILNNGKNHNEETLQNEIPLDCKNASHYDFENGINYCEEYANDFIPRED